MSDPVAYTLAALALAFGVTALTTFAVRSENDHKLVGWSFVASFLVIAAAFFAAHLPRPLALPLGFAGLLLGVVFASGLKVARELERRAGT